MTKNNENIFRTFNQYVRPTIPQKIGAKYYRGNNKPIDICRYHDTYDVGIGIIYSDYARLIHKEYSLKKDGFFVVRRNCSNPHCRFCPHIRQFRLADGKLYTSPTAEDFRRTLPDGPLMVPTYLMMKHKTEKLIRFEKEIAWLGKFEKKIMGELDQIIEHFSNQMREVDKELVPYDAFYFRWAPLADLPEQEIVGPYTPLWGARLDQALVLLRGGMRKCEGGSTPFIMAAWVIIVQSGQSYFSPLWRIARQGMCRDTSGALLSSRRPQGRSPTSHTCLLEGRAG
jgi:hypothetical protein